MTRIRRVEKEILKGHSGFIMRLFDSNGQSEVDFEIFGPQPNPKVWTSSDHFRLDKKEA
jgi:hypothetical protein